MQHAAAQPQGPESADVAELVRSCLPLVQYIVSDVAGRLPRHVQRDELVSAGMLGLAQAAKAWDPARGVTFDRYARTRIQGAVLDELRSRDWATRSVRADARRLRVVTEEIADATGAASQQAIAAAMGISMGELERLNKDIHRATVLQYDAVFVDSEDGPVTGVEGDVTLDQLLQRETIGYLRDAIVMLPERLRKVVVEYFFEERQMQEIADDLGVTESRISQMRAEAIVLLRTALNEMLEPTDESGSAPASNDRASRRTAAYLAEVAAASTYRARISADAPGVAQRVRTA